MACPVSESPLGDLIRCKRAGTRLAVNVSCDLILPRGGGGELVNVSCDLILPRGGGGEFAILVSCVIDLSRRCRLLLRSQLQLW